MEIRKATIDDIKDISRIHALSWKAAYKGIVPQAYLDELKEDFWVPAFETWAKNNMLTLQLIIANGSAIGCVAYGKARDTTLSNWGEIVSIYLLPDYFGKGYGSKLLRETLSDLNQNGYQDIYLWVLKENQPARRFYKKNNFRCTDDECICEIMGTKLTELRYTYSFDPTS